MKNPTQSLAAWLGLGVAISLFWPLMSLRAAAPKPETAKVEKADPAAHALLKAAHDKRETFPPNFAGFTADVVFNDNGKMSTGELTYKPGSKSKVNVEGLNEETHGWLEDRLLSMLAHRQGRAFTESDGRHPITFGADDGSPLGRQLILHDALQSTYRVRNDQIMDVTRTMGDTKFTITMLENIQTESGKYLPHHFVVSYFDAKSGALQMVEQYTDSYTKIGDIWLPTARRVIIAADGKMTVRVIELRDLKLL
ncbi:MAG: DUF3386 domain-containing protein [Armatimonadota bacterium]|nr:DUF3386 domain-containing protein [Armatimonadota bacterium]